MGNNYKIQVGFWVNAIAEVGLINTIDGSVLSFVRMKASTAYQDSHVFDISFSETGIESMISVF